VATTHSSNACGSEDRLSTEAKKFSSEVTFDRAGNPEVQFDLGQLPLNQRTSVVLEVHNPTSRTFVFEKIAKACSCTDVKITSKTLEPEGTLTVLVSLDPPGRLTTPVIYNSLFLQMEPGKGITLRIRNSYEGILTFGVKSVVAEFGAEDRAQSFSIPLLLTSPVDFENVEVSVSEGLTGLTLRKVQTVDSFAFECALDDKLFEKGGLGELTVRHQKSGRSDTIPCSIERKPAIKLMPSVLRFAPKSEEGKSTDQEVATLLIRIDSSYLHWKDEVQQGTESHVEFSLVEPPQGYEIQVTRLAVGLYRAFVKRPRIELKGSSSNQSPQSLRISATTTEHELFVQCKVGI
jgi:hypothetical protein